MIWHLLIALMLSGCLTDQDAERWRPFGEAEAVWINLSPEARQLLAQFPLVQILDEHLDYTTDIVWFDVRDQSGDEFVLFYRYWDQAWIKRTPNPDGTFTFEPYP